MKPRKRFGQNFLQDENVIEQIVKAVALKTDDHLVEIGPGLGALTKAFFPLIKRFDLIELDRDLIPKLEAICCTNSNCIIHQADVLHFDFKKIFFEKKLRLVGNLPYNISTPLLFYLLKFQNHIQDLHFMLQREVAERLVAEPNSKAYGRLSVMMQYHFKMQLLFIVPPEAFFPKPKVQSAFVRFTPKAKPEHPAKDLLLFGNIVRQAFSQRRKTIQNSLKNFVSKEQLQALKINAKARPEQLTVQDFVRISNSIG